MGVKDPPGCGAHGLHANQVKQVMVTSGSGRAILAPIVIATSLLNGGWLTSKCRVTAVVRLIITWVIIRKVDAASVRTHYPLRTPFERVGSSWSWGQVVCGHQMSVPSGISGSDIVCDTQKE